MSHTESDVEDISEDLDIEHEDSLVFDEEAIEEEPLVLRTEDFISGPFSGDNATLPSDILQFEYPSRIFCRNNISFNFLNLH